MLGVAIAGPESHRPVAVVPFVAGLAAHKELRELLVSQVVGDGVHQLEFILLIAAHQQRARADFHARLGGLLIHTLSVQGVSDVLAVSLDAEPLLRDQDLLHLRPQLHEQRAGVEEPLLLVHLGIGEFQHLDRIQHGAESLDGLALGGVFVHLLGRPRRNHRQVVVHLLVGLDEGSLVQLLVGADVVADGDHPGFGLADECRVIAEDLRIRGGLGDPVERDLDHAGAVGAVNGADAGERIGLGENVALEADRPLPLFIAELHDLVRAGIADRLQADRLADRHAHAREDQRIAQLDGGGRG